MNLRWLRVVSVSVIASSFVVSAFFYSLLPNRIVTHWDVNGIANGSMSKGWGLFLMPTVLVGLYALLTLLPNIDPLRKNIERFGRPYHTFILILTVFLFYVHALTIGANVHGKIDLAAFLSPAMGVLFFAIGALLPRTHRNWFIGIRTPWTLQSDRIWEKTHRLGGTLFQITGVLIIVFGLFGPAPFFFFSIAAIAISSLVSVVYSYLLFHEQQ